MSRPEGRLRKGKMSLLDIAVAVHGLSLIPEPHG